MRVTIDETFIRNFIDKHNIGILGEKNQGDKRVLMLDKCPFNENHVNGESSIIIRPKSIGFKCQHDSCKDKHIKEFLQHYEPNFELPGAQIKAKRTPKVLCVADIEKKTLKYLLEPYIVKNNITILAGDGGIGKSFVWVDIASAITRGVLPAIMGVPKEFNTSTEVKTYDWNDEIQADKPNENQGENRKVLYFTSEDDTATQLKERFEMAGADQRNLFCVPLDDDDFHNVMLDSQELEDIIADVRPALVVLDPLQSFVKGKMAERNNMRRQMDCLTRLATVYDTSFLIVVHTNKQTTSDARTKLSDSSDIWDKCRSVLFVGWTTDRLRYLSQEKGNYTTSDNRLDTQLFTITDGHIEHKGTTPKKYFDFATERNFSNRESSAKDSCKEFILTSLKDGEMLVKDLEESAKSFGISDKTLRGAKYELKKDNQIIYRKDSEGKGKGVQWYISLNPLSKGRNE